MRHRLKNIDIDKINWKEFKINSSHFCHRNKELLLVVFIFWVILLLIANYEKYSNLYWILNIFSIFNQESYFGDPASVYAYRLNQFHEFVMIFASIIIVCVYSILFWIIKEYTWIASFSIDNNKYKSQHIILPENALLFKDQYFDKFKLLYKYRSYKCFVQVLRLYMKFDDFCFKMYKQRIVPRIKHKSPSIIAIYLFLIRFNQSFFWFLGFQRKMRDRFNKEDKNNKIALDGSWLFANERKLYTFSPNIGSYVSEATQWEISNDIIAELTLTSYLDKLTLSPYKTNNIFFNGYLSKYKYSKRRANLLTNNTSLFGVLEALNHGTLLMRRISSKPVKNSNKMLVSDAFFESSDFKHSFSVELVWAILPTITVIHILIPSLILLYSLDDEIDPDLTIKVIGHQWYWSYEFDNWVEINTNVHEFVSFNYESYLVSIDDLEKGTKRLLEVDKRLILPINITLRFIITSGDVLHAWAVPSLGIKSDAVPGRLNQFLAFITYPGVYYGQCSESCGAAHGFMPIVVQGVTFPVFVTWLKESNFC